MSNNQNNNVKKRRIKNWPQWSKAEIEAIRYYLSERGRDCLVALERCEEMNCAQLKNWVNKEREYWNNMYSCIRWLIYHIPKTNKTKRKN